MLAQGKWHEDENDWVYLHELYQIRPNFGSGFLNLNVIDLVLNCTIDITSKLQNLCVWFKIVIIVH